MLYITYCQGNAYQNTTMRYHVISVRITHITKNKKTSSIGMDVKKWEPLFNVGENINGFKLFGKQYEYTSKLIFHMTQ